MAYFVDPANRSTATGVHDTYKQPPPASNSSLRDEDVQVLHCFQTVADAKAYLTSDLFTRDVVGGLSPLLKAAPEVQVHDTV